jgi:hypothetical protein
MNAIKRFAKSIFFVLLVLGLFASSVRTAQAAAATCEQYYTVQRGDYLVAIGREFNVSWRYLADINDLADPTRIYPGQQLCVKATGSPTNPSQPATGSGGQVWADQVVEDQYAIIEGQNLAANTRYNVVFSRYGTSIDSGYRVGSDTSDGDGDLIGTFYIPSQLADVRQITVSLLSGSRVAAQNWFYNATATGETGGEEDDDAAQNLSLRVVDVNEDEDVTVEGSSFPAYTDFTVYMADRQASSLRWIEIGLYETGSKSTFKVALDIPAQLHGANQISILFDSQGSKYDVSTWFNNSDDQEADVPSFPFLTVIEVVRDEEVTIRFTNLPAGVTYDVLMGKIGTKGEDGILVGTVRSQSGGTVVKSFPIPSALRGDSTIAVRMEAPSRGPNAYAYNWFRNQTTP